MAEDFREFWRDDFNCLKHAGRMITEAMRRDEQRLEDRINTGHNPSSHLYFAVEEKDAPLKFDRRIPFPHWIKEKKPSKHFRVGLWSQAELAWAIIDDTVYIWNFLVDNAAPYIFSTNSKQPIIGVGLVPPKKGVFVANIEWCLVVTTIEKVFLSALYRSDSAYGPSQGSDALLLIANVFKVSSDDVRLTVVTGSKEGRIFLGGDNGEIYAVDYWGEGSDDSLDTKLNEFYDGNREIGPVLSRDASLTEIIRKRLGETLTDQPSRKCRKLECGNAKDGYTLTNLFFKNGDGVAKLVVDDDRGLLFAMTKNGFLSLRSLSDPTKVLTKLNVTESAKAFLERVGRRAESQTHQAAVGGHDMARTIAKRGPGLLRPVSIQNISQAESQKYCLVIVTSGGLRLFYSIATNNRLMLTHIRGAQPLLDLNGGNLEVDNTGGYLPTFSERSVTAAHYKTGFFLAVYSGPVNNSIILAASGPDSQLREMKQNGKDYVQVPGGITETISFPLGQAKLTGQHIWDIGEIVNHKQAETLQTMSLYSATPTDQDLRRLSVPKPFSTPKQSSGSARDADATKYVLLDLFGRPKHGRITKSNADRTGRFRLSKRCAAGGFSSTAVMKRSSTLRISAQSSKLKAWSLHPKQTTLEYMAAQYPPEESQLVVVNADGFHVFNRTWPIKQFELAISHTGGELFFNKFRRRECCSMGLALAMGLHSSTRCQDQAKKLVLQQGKLPSLRLRSDDGGNRPTTATTNAEDSLVPIGYEFSPSPLCEGLVLLLSRLMRPVWHKTIIAVTEGPKVTQSGIPTILYPAKVELLLDESSMEDLLLRFSRLQDLILQMFDLAVATVPGTINPNSDIMEVDENVGGSMFAHHQAMTSISRTANISQVIDTTRLSRKLEERNIHSLYRTLCRSIQLVKLFLHLRNRRQMKSLPSSTTVHWGLLHGITFSEFVESAEGQDRLEGLLNTLLVSTQQRANNASLQSVEEFIRYLSENCFYFFPAGLQSACIGHQLASRALAVGNRSPEFESLRSKAASRFLEASRHWQNPGLITGCSIYEERSNVHGAIVHTAERNGSPLALAARTLIELGDSVSMADICLQVAANFRSWKGTPSISGSENSRSRARLQWEELLYHQGHRETSASSGNNIQSPRKASVNSEVTADDAVSTCYALIFDTFTKLFGDRRDLADSMLSFCLSSRDRNFLEKMFEFLLERNQDVLLTIESLDLEKWLEAKEDPYLYWRYLNVRGKAGEGGQLAVDIASDRSKQVSIATRIEWLRRATSSYADLARPKNPAVESRSEEASLKLKIALVQQRILESLQSQALSHNMKSNEAGKLDEDIKKLKSDLCPVTDLYNTFAAKRGLVEDCLRILHACGNNAEEECNRLWRCLICNELLPCDTRRIETFQYLTALAADFGRDDKVSLLSDNEQGSRLVFEDGTWAEKLRNKVVVLGKEIYKPNNCSVFPVDKLIKIFEELRSLVGDKFSPSWSLVMMVDAGVPVLNVLKTFDSVESTGFVFQSELDSDLLGKATAQIELIEYVLSNDPIVERDRLLLVLESIKSRIENISTETTLHERIQRIYDRKLPPAQNLRIRLGS